MQNFKLWNNIVGWAVFGIAAFTYISTMEPTASFWDCGEFIAVSYKLMVPHPPGAPLFLMIGRMFSLLAGDDVTQVAYYVNMVSALCSAFTIPFLYWSIVYLATRLVKKDTKPGDLPLWDQVLVMAAGAVGATAYTFSDSFWFSGVEAEVYAASSLFTAIVFWAVMKWDSIAEEENADKWLIFIAYVIGLSIGVHLLSLLAVPSLAFIYYFKKYKPTAMGTVLAFVAGYGGIFLIQSVIIPGLPSIAAKIEIFSKNSIGLPFNTGTIIFFLAVIGGMIYGLLYSIKNNKYELKLGMLSLLFIMIGYASYGVILVRSNFNPPINENDPSDVISFVSYLKREQYGDRPILRGPQYNAQPIEQKQGDAIYVKKGDKYVIADHKIENVYADKDKVFFPRLYSQQPGHIQAYKQWVKLPEDPSRKPSGGANFSFFFKYQIGHMFFRYLGWNFIGKAGDVQDDGVLFLGSDDGIPEQVAQNKARNRFFAIPLILGIIGLIYQLLKDERNWLVVLTLFFTTGIALIIFANPPPAEPRERDYAFTGATYAFAMWIGLGVVGIAKLTKMAGPVVLVAALVGFVAPAIMAKEGWDDHDRHNRFHSVDSARNMLASCEKNAILFTGGDNDTFPLWYVQEVEGFRTDVRVCNLSLLGTHWYGVQMKNKVYESDGLPISLPNDQIGQGTNEYLPMDESSPIYGRELELANFIKLLGSGDGSLSRQLQNGMNVNIVPTNKFKVTIDTAAVIASGIVPEQFKQFMVNKLDINWGRGAIVKNDLLMLDMIATNAATGWKRPIYFASSLSGSNYLGLKESMVMEGLAYRLLPIKIPGASQGAVNTTVMYNKLMKEYAYRGLNDPNAYFDENYRRFPLSLRMSFQRLTEALINEGKNEEAKAVIKKCFEIMPDKTIPYDPYTPRFVLFMMKVGMAKEAKEIAAIMAARSEQILSYYSQPGQRNEGEIQNNLYILQELYMSFAQAGDNATADKYKALLEKNSALLPPDQNQGELD